MSDLGFSYTADPAAVIEICEEIVPINQELQRYSDEMTTHLSQLQRSQGYDRLSKNVLSEYKGIGDEYAGLIIDEANTFYSLAGLVAKFDAGNIDAESTGTGASAEKDWTIGATLGMAVLNLAEGFGTGVETFVDGFLTIGAVITDWVGADGVSQWLTDRVENDAVGQFFDEQYQNGIFQGINEKSAYKYNDTAAAVIKGVGTAGAYVALTGLTGRLPGVKGLSNIVSKVPKVGKYIAPGIAEATTTFMGTLGFSTSNNLKDGDDIRTAAGKGAKVAAAAAVSDLAIEGVVNFGAAKLGKATAAASSADNITSTKTVDANGHTTRTREVVDNNIKTTTVVDDATNTTKITKQQVGSSDKVTEIFDADGNHTTTVKETFDANKMKTTSTTDVKTGTTQTQKFDVDGKTVTENSVTKVQPDGTIETKHYEGAKQDKLKGSTEISTDANTGRTTTKNFDVNGKETSSAITSADGKPISTSETDLKTGEISTKTYGKDGTTVTENSKLTIDANGNKKIDVYDGDTQTTLKSRTEIDITGNEKVYGKDGTTVIENSKLTIDTNGNKKIEVYDGDTQTTLKSKTEIEIDSKGNTIKHNYGADGTTKVSTSKTDAVTGTTRQSNFAADGKTVESVDIFDANNNKIATSKVNSSGEIETNYLDATGKKTGAKTVETKDATGNITRTNFDTDGTTVKSRVEVDKATGNTTQTNFAADGKTVKSKVEVDAANHKSTQTNFAADGKTVKSTVEIDPATGKSTQTNFAADGTTKTSVVDIEPNGKKSTVEFADDGKKPLSRTTETTTPDGKKTTVVNTPDGKNVTTTDTPDGRHIVDIDDGKKHTQEILDIDGTKTKITDGPNKTKIIETTSPDGRTVRKTEFDDGTIKPTVRQSIANAVDVPKTSLKGAVDDAVDALKHPVNTFVKESVSHPGRTIAAIHNHMHDVNSGDIEIPDAGTEEGTVPQGDASVCPSCGLPADQCNCTTPGTPDNTPNDTVGGNNNNNAWDNGYGGDGYTGGGTGGDGGYDYPEYETPTYPEYEIPTYPEYEMPTYPEYETPTYPDTDIDGSDGNDGNDGSNGDDGSSYPWGDNNWGGGTSGPGASDFVDDLGNSSEDTKVSIEDTLEDATASLDEIIDMTTGVNIPTSANPIKSTINTKDNNMVPLMAGLGAAALAGLGTKAYLDHKENKDNEEEIEAEEWEEDLSESDSLGLQESDYLMPTDEFAYQPEGANMTIEDEGEKYQAVNSSELPSIN